MLPLAKAAVVVGHDEPSLGACKNLAIKSGAVQLAGRLMESGRYSGLIVWKMKSSHE